MASARMLTQILRNDNVAYTLRPVLNFADVQHSYSLKTDDITTIFMINCGAVSTVSQSLKAQFRNRWKIILFLCILVFSDVHLLFLFLSLDL